MQNTPATPGGMPSQSRGILIGCGIAAAIILVLIVGCSVIASMAINGNGTHKSTRVTRSKNAAPKKNVASVPTHTGCSGATFFGNRATGEINSGRYQAAYDDAVAGLNRVDACDGSEQIRSRGYLLGGKALSEHHLSSGDSVTDLNQAITLLAECQTEPDYYGTQIGAGCQTEEETLISYKTQWEMDNY